MIFKKIRNGLLGNEVSLKFLSNTSWLVGDKIFTMAIGVVVTSIVARHFGPDNYGEFNYALSLVTLFTGLSTLGLETLTVKALVDKNEDEGTILCTSLVLRVVGGLLLTFFSFVLIRMIEPENDKLHALVLILSLTMVFKALEVIEYWIQAHQKAKISSMIRMSSYVVIAGFKILLVVTGGSIIHYAYIYVIDSIIIGAGLMIAYFRDKNIKWRFDINYAKSILSQSWYLIISGMLGTLYMQIDKLMLGSMMPTTVELGIYSAAVQIANMWYFVPMAIITSFKPLIMARKKIEEKYYLDSIQLLYTVIAWVGILFSVFITVFSGPIITILYGPEFGQASRILSISVWGGTFAMLGSARGIWMVTEGLQRYSVIYIGSGAAVNILINYILIPELGGYGAAIATVISQITTSIVAPLFIKQTRLSSIMFLKAFLLKGVRKQEKN